MSNNPLPFNKLHKVVNTYYVDEADRGSTYASGIVLELEDGRFIGHVQDGMIQPTAGIKVEIE